MHFNLEQRELTLKLVYYGPALSGKTTNLQSIHRILKPEGRGHLLTLDTRNDRTLFFDLLPVFFNTPTGLKVKLKLFTVPGQVVHNSTRKLVLSGADGVVFVADSQRSMTRANNESWENMIVNFNANGLDPGKIPVVIQFNKRDLADVRTEKEIEEIARNGREMVTRSVATTGEGVIETLLGLLRGTWRSLDRRYELEKKFRFSEGEFIENICAHMNDAGRPSC
jgi:signal recognition particle receptor subunit beta